MQMGYWSCSCDWRNDGYTDLLKKKEQASNQLQFIVYIIYINQLQFMV